MIVLKGNKFLFCDVDDTLVLSVITDEDDEHDIEITHEINGMKITEWRVPHKKHIQEIIDHKASFGTVVIWTQNSVEWAEAVVKALGLESHVDLVTSKPHRIIDDLKLDEFIPKPEWMEIE